VSPGATIFIINNNNSGSGNGTGCRTTLGVGGFSEVGAGLSVGLGVDVGLNAPSSQIQYPQLEAPGLSQTPVKSELPPVVSYLSSPQKIPYTWGREDNLTTPPPLHDANEHSGFYSQDSRPPTLSLAEDTTTDSLRMPSFPSETPEGETVSKKKRKRKEPTLGEDGLPIKRARKKKKVEPPTLLDESQNLQCDTEGAEDVEKDAFAFVDDDEVAPCLEITLRLEHESNLDTSIDEGEIVAVLKKKSSKKGSRMSGDAKTPREPRTPKEPRIRKEPKKSKDPKTPKEPKETIDEDSETQSTPKIVKTPREPRTPKDRIRREPKPGSKKKGAGRKRVVPVIMDESTMIDGDEAVDVTSEGIASEDQPPEDVAESIEEPEKEKPKLPARPKSRKKR